MNGLFDNLMVFSVLGAYFLVTQANALVRKLPVDAYRKDTINHTWERAKDAVSKRQDELSDVDIQSLKKAEILDRVEEKLGDEPFKVFSLGFKLGEILSIDSKDFTDAVLLFNMDSFELKELFNIGYADGAAWDGDGMLSKDYRETLLLNSTKFIAYICSELSEDERAQMIEAYEEGLSSENGQIDSENEVENTVLNTEFAFINYLGFNIGYNLFGTGADEISALLNMSVSARDGDAGSEEVSKTDAFRAIIKFAFRVLKKIVGSLLKTNEADSPSSAEASDESNEKTYEAIPDDSSPQSADIEDMPDDMSGDMPDATARA